MNQQQLDIMKNKSGFIAAMDQSGGSSPKALAGYGVAETEYNTEEEMFNLIHQMRTRVITNSAFKPDKIIGAILFKETMRNKMEGLPTTEYLWQKKHIVPFLKVDEGLAELQEGVQLMKPMQELDSLLKEAQKNNVFGTKMRSVIKEANPIGIKKVVEQQFYYAEKIMAAGLVPIIEPEVDIHSQDKAESEAILKQEILKYLVNLADNRLVMLKLSLPDQPDFYQELIDHPKVVRVVALSGGYEQQEAVDLLAKNHAMIASYSRALLQDLQVEQSEAEFTSVLESAINKIYQASLT